MSTYLLVFMESGNIYNLLEQMEIIGGQGWLG